MYIFDSVPMVLVMIMFYVWYLSQVRVSLDSQQEPLDDGSFLSTDGLEYIIRHIKHIGFIYVRCHSDFCYSKEVHWFKGWVFSLYL